MQKFEGKFNAFRAIIYLNNSGNFIGFSTPQRKFAINNVLLPLSTQHFAMHRAEVQQCDEQSLHVIDSIDHSCNLHKIYFNNCRVKLVVVTCRSLIRREL